MWNERGVQIKAPRASVLRQYANAQLGRSCRAGKNLRLLHQTPANTLVTVARKHCKIGNQGIGTRRIVQAGEGLVCNHGNKADHAAVMLRHKHPAHGLSAVRMHLFAIRIGHCIARPDARIDRTLEILELDHACAEPARIARSILTNDVFHDHVVRVNDQTLQGL